MPQSFLLSESHGLERTAEPVAVTASFYPEELPDPSALELLDEQGASVPFQAADLFDAPTTGPKTRHSKHCRIYFLAEVPAHGQRKYKLEIRERADTVESEKPAAAATDLQVSSEKLALCVENRHLAVSLDPASGQIFSFKNKAARVTLDSPRTEGWDPDTFDPNRGWPRPFDWHSQPKVTFEQGPLFFQLYRVGTLKQYPEITLHMTYRLYAGVPYLWTNTVIEINEDVPLMCLRNEEFVFKDSHFTHLAWQESDGCVVTRPLEGLRPINRHGDIVKVHPETPWVGFAHPGKGHGIATLHLSSAHFNRQGGPLRLRDHSCYLIKAGALNGVYWVRPFIYWPQHTKRDQLLVAAAGSVYTDESAYCLAGTSDPQSPKDEEALYAQFSNAFSRLKHPLYAEVEDRLTEKIRGRREA